MGAQERFQLQIAHLNEPDVLARFTEDKGGPDITPESYLIDYGGAPGGSRPDLYERVCYDLCIDPRIHATYVTPESIRVLAENVLRSNSIGEALILAELVLEML